ncbi:MerC domain-containing protein [Belliella marina]|uniref:MerC domain-containing protein n=1 Tax=Belliella marina TaxID=1644146 RepID=A0ABW4VU59_9BACT
MLQIIKRISAQSADFMGISASVLCLIHCLAFPILISMGFIFNSDEHHHHDHDHAHIHWHWMDFLFVFLAVWAVINAAKSTQSKAIKIALWVAVSIFSVGVLLHDVYSWMIFVSLVASISLVIIHIINWKYHRNCKVIVK